MSPTIICPKRHGDPRGWFSETWNEERFAAAGIAVRFCQDNQSYSKAKGTLRGLHCQRPPSAQAKLVRCLQGRIFDVAVDVRRASPTFGQWVAAELSADDGRQLFIPAGYAHGFLTLSDDCMVAYKVDAYYAAEDDGGIAWNDPAIRIDWPIDSEPVLSDKDMKLPALRELKAEFPYDGQPLAPLREISF